MHDEIDAGVGRLPACTDDPMFWHTITELTSSLALTSFFVLSKTPNGNRLEEQLRVSADYVFDAAQSRHGPTMTMSKSPDLMTSRAPAVAFSVTRAGEFVETDLQFTPDGRRMGIEVATYHHGSVGICALRHRGCEADTDLNELTTVELSSRSRLEICEHCLKVQTESGLWLADVPEPASRQA